MVTRIKYVYPYVVGIIPIIFYKLVEISHYFIPLDFFLTHKFYLEIQVTLFNFLISVFTVQNVCYLLTVNCFYVSLKHFQVLLL